MNDGYIKNFETEKNLCSYISYKHRLTLLLS